MHLYIYIYIYIEREREREREREIFIFIYIYVYMWQKQVVTFFLLCGYNKLYYAKISLLYRLTRESSAKNNKRGYILIDNIVLYT